MKDSPETFGLWLENKGEIDHACTVLVNSGFKFLRNSIEVHALLGGEQRVEDIRSGVPTRRLGPWVPQGEAHLEPLESDILMAELRKSAMDRKRSTDGYWQKSQHMLDSYRSNT